MYMRDSTGYPPTVTYLQVSSEVLLYVNVFLIVFMVRNILHRLSDYVF